MNLTKKDHLLTGGHRLPMLMAEPGVNETFIDLSCRASADLVMRKFRNEQLIAKQRKGHEDGNEEL